VPPSAKLIPVKVFISVDIEGITGLVSWSQCSRPDGGSYDYPFARRMMTHDLNAAIRGARIAGATKIVIKDSHGNSKNLLIDELEPGVELISGHGSGRDGMMEGIDATFDAALLVGYHAKAGTERGIMEHTYTGRSHRLFVNEQEVGEMALSAGTAGRYGVPLVFVSSDDRGCAEAASLIPNITTVTTKFGLGRYMGRLLHPSETGPAIEQGVTAALQNIQTKPWHPSEPCTVRLETNRTEDADWAAKIPGVRRVDGYNVEIQAATYSEAQSWAVVLLSVGALGPGSHD
jgi:D-amino peptidase